MICAHCGALNPNGSEKCVHCGRQPIAGGTVMCSDHPHRVSTGVCLLCDKPLCDECQVLIEGSTYCRTDAAPIDGADEGHNPPVINPADAVAATFMDRITAGVLDLAIIAAYLLVIYLVLWALTGSPPSYPDAGGWQVLFWLLAVLGPVGYLCWENADGGQTAGKSASGLIVLREDGTLMDARTGVLRGLLSAVGFLIGGIGFWYMLWSPNKRALHDQLLGTIVVKTNSE